MSKRPLTPEEKQLWRESNRFTEKKPEHAEAEAVEPLEAVAPTPRAKLPTAVKPTPAPRKPVTANLAPLPAREARKHRTRHPEVEATLDLHGDGKLEAYGKVDAFLRRAAKGGKRHVAIITGKGRVGEGLLRRELPHWLNEPHLRPLVAQMFHASEREGGNGVLHILLKRLTAQ